MNVLTDSELNARVAVIEGWEYHDSGDYWSWDGMTTPFWRHEIPYTTAWSLAGPLIEKYRLALYHHNEDPRCWFAGDEWESTPQRAICLAVIAIAGEGK